MTLYISYSKWSSVTGRKLKEALGCQRFSKWVTYKRRGQRTGDIVINWGASVGHGISERLYAKATAKMLNTPDMLALNKDKHGALVLMHAASVSAVPSWLIADVPADAYPVVARTPNHFGGSGLWRCNNKEELMAARGRGANHATKLLIKAGEFRVHILLDKAVRIVRKVKAREDAIDLCRSHKNGWKFKQVAVGNIPVGLEVLAANAVKAIGLQMGAVDVVLQKGTNKLIVLEVNSTPGLEGHSLEAWATALKTLRDS